MKNLYNILRLQGIEDAKAINLSSCTVRKQYLLDRLDFKPETAVIGLIPYYPETFDRAPFRTVSVYSAPKDYHLFVRELEDRVCKEASDAYPGYHFAFFADRSPIDERDAAARAGLGIIGRNGLLISEKHSSFVFIFEIITDLETDCEGHEPQFCEECGLCIKSCPVQADISRCLSALTQKKGRLTEDEQKIIKENGCIWGCDICQNVCPHTKNARTDGTLYTKIPFFNEHIISAPTRKTVSDAEDFAQRAYSWRGAETVLRNMELFENNSKCNKNEETKGGNRE